MTWVDWLILIVLALSVLGGLEQGFFRSVCSLGGLVLGLCWRRGTMRALAALLKPLVRFERLPTPLGSC